MLSSEYEFDSFNAHIGEVSQIIISPDGRYVFSAGSDGSIFIYSVLSLIMKTVKSSKKL